MHSVQETKHTNHNGSQLYVAELNQYYKPWEFISLDYKQSTGHQTGTLIIPEFMRAVTRHRTQLLQLSGTFQNQTSSTTLPLLRISETTPASQPSAFSKPNHTNHYSLQSYITSSHIRKRSSTQTSRGPRTIATFKTDDPLQPSASTAIPSAKNKPRQYKL